MKTFRTILLCTFAAIALFGMLLIFDIMQAMWQAAS
jgi:hypothetical protein